MAITFTSADLDALKEAFLTGAKVVRIGERTVEYRSQADLLQAIRMVQDYLDGQSTDDSPNLIQTTYKKGDS